jgi:DNA-binding transcriptional ArsR family regulator
MSRPAVSQHLRILLDAGLVTEQRHGREGAIALSPRGSARCGTGSRIMSSSETTASSVFRSSYPKGVKTD